MVGPEYMFYILYFYNYTSGTFQTRFKIGMYSKFIHTLKDETPISPIRDRKTYCLYVQFLK